MFTVQHFSKVSIGLALLLIIHIPILFYIYSDLFPAFVIPFFTTGLGVLTGILYESSLGIGIFSSQAHEIDIQRGLLPFSKLIPGLFWPILFAWDDIFLQSEELKQLWFWAMVTASYTSFIMGIVFVRNRTICKAISNQERYDDIKLRRSSSNAALESELPFD